MFSCYRMCSLTSDVVSVTTPRLFVAESRVCMSCFTITVAVSESVSVSVSVFVSVSVSVSVSVAVFV